MTNECDELRKKVSELGKDLSNLRKAFIGTTAILLIYIGGVLYLLIASGCH